MPATPVSPAAPEEAAAQGKSEKAAAQGKLQKAAAQGKSEKAAVSEGKSAKAAPEKDMGKHLGKSEKSKMFKCKVYGDCPKGWTDEPTDKYPEHSEEYMCKVYGQCDGKNAKKSDSKKP